MAFTCSDCPKRAPLVAHRGLIISSADCKMVEINNILMLTALRQTSSNCQRVISTLQVPRWPVCIYSVLVKIYCCWNHKRHRLLLSVRQLNGIKLMLDEKHIPTNYFTNAKKRSLLFTKSTPLSPFVPASAQHTNDCVSI